MLARLRRATPRDVNRALSEPVVTARVREAVFQPELVREVVDMVNDRLARLSGESRVELAELDRALGRLAEQQQRYYRAIEEGKLDLEVVNRRLHELKDEEDLLARKKVELEQTLADDQPIETSDAEIARHVQALTSLLETSSPKALRGFLETFIKRIVVYPEGRVDIHYLAPLEGLALLSRAAERPGFEPGTELLGPVTT